MLGESGVGKSSVLGKFAYGNFQPGAMPTISPHFIQKTQTIYKIGSHKVKFNIWDTAGQEKYRCLTRMYFRDANVAIIVFDVTNRKSFNSVDYWAQEVAKSSAEDFFIVLVGNKGDLVKQRQVNYEEGQEKANKIDASFYIETSAISEKSVQDLFQEVGIKLFKKADDDEVPEEDCIDISYSKSMVFQTVTEKKNKFRPNRNSPHNKTKSIRLNKASHISTRKNSQEGFKVQSSCC